MPLKLIFKRKHRSNITITAISSMHTSQLAKPKLRLSFFLWGTTLCKGVPSLWRLLVHALLQLPKGFSFDGFQRPQQLLLSIGPLVLAFKDKLFQLKAFRAGPRRNVRRIVFKSRKLGLRLRLEQRYPFLAELLLLNSVIPLPF